MKISFLKYLFISTIVSVFVYACVKKTSYAPTPEIEYKDYLQISKDSANLEVKFTDGDGDIGVSESDSTKTFWITYYYKDSITQKYVGYYRPLTNDTLRIGYIVKSPSDAYKGKSISGEISVLVPKRHSKKIKNVKYVVYLLDKAGNKSNVITTPELFIQ